MYRNNNQIFRDYICNSEDRIHYDTEIPYPFVLYNKIWLRPYVINMDELRKKDKQKKEEK